MMFIVTLISLIIERYFHWSHLRYWRWYFRYQHSVHARLSRWSTLFTLLACILPLMIVVGLIQLVLTGIFYDIFRILFDVIVLVYCLGPNNLWVDAYAARNNREKAESLFGIPKLESPQEFHYALTRAIFVEAHQRIFAVLFWFVILGPMGAVLYRTVDLCSEQHELGLSAMADLWRRVLDWIPARLFTFLFALGGHFTEVFNVWKVNAKKGIYENEKLIGDCGLAAMDTKRSEQLPEDGSAETEALLLLDRVWIIGLVVLAMIVLLM